MTHCRRLTNPSTSKCNNSFCMHATFRRISSFNSDKLDGWDRYTSDFKYSQSQKSVSVLSGILGGRGNFQPLLINLFFPNVCIKNSFTGVAVWPVAISCINITVKITSFSSKYGTIFPSKSAKQRSAFKVVLFHPFFWTIVSKKKGPMMKEFVKPYQTVIFGECNRFWVYSHGLDVAQILQL